MQRASYLIAALGLGLVAPSSAAPPYDDAAREFRKGTPVVVVGRISSQPRNSGFTHEGKMQVSVGPNRRDYTLHLNDALITGPNGGVAGISDIQDRWWVQAEGRVMDDPRRIEVKRMRVFSKRRENLLGTAYYRPGMPHGYVTAVSTSRQQYR